MHETDHEQSTGYAVTDCDAALLLGQLTEPVRARALRQTQRGWVISGVVLTQPISTWKTIVDEAGARGVSPSDMKRLMKWEPLCDSGVVPGGPADVSNDEASPGVVHTSDSGVALADSTLSRAVQKLALESGCCFINSDPAGAGWRAPGNQTVYANALDALTAAVRTFAPSLSVVAVQEQATKPHEIVPQATPNQEALF